jgi:drug/metabolite transporter (DMT)-like permease
MGAAPLHAPVTPAAKPKLLPTRVLIQFAIITLIWGSTWLVIRTQLDVVPPSWSVAYRFLTAGTMMAAFCLATRRSLRVPAGGHGFFLGMALFQFVLNFNLVYRAESYVTSGLVAVAFALLIVPNAVFAWAFLGQRVTLRFAWGALLGITGVSLLFWREFGEIGHGAGIGLLLTLLGVLSASVSNVMQASARGRSLDIFVTLAWSMLYGGIANAAIAWALSGPPVIQPTLGYVGGVLYLAGAASAVAFAIYYDLIRAVGPARAAYSSVVIPFVAMALSTVFEGYEWSPIAFAGGALTLCGLYIALRARAR